MDFFSSFRSNKSRDKWVNRADKDEIHEALTKLFVNGNQDLGISDALTADELAAFKKNFKSISQANTGLNNLLAAYGGYPFAPSSLPLNHDSLLRAVVALTSRDTALNGSRSLHSVATQTDRVVERGRNTENRLQLLFRALAGDAPDAEDILDVLVIVQPRPNPTKSPLDRSDLLPMATKLASSKAIRDVTISGEKLLDFLQRIGIEAVEVNETVSFEDFKKVVEERPGIVDAVAAKAETYLKA